MPTATPVTADNFVRAETDMYFGNFVKEGGFGKFYHNRELAPLDHQIIIRMNRDTVYSAAVFDLDAGPVTISLPDANGRFMSMQVLDEDQYVVDVVYDGSHTYSKDKIGTRYLGAMIRTLVDPNNPGDDARVHALQDAIRIEKREPGRFEPPAWEPASQKKVRDALLMLAESLTGSDGAFGPRGKVNPVHYLICAAAGWGGNPPEAATYLAFTPPQNDGKAVYRFTVKDVPVDGFWSVIVYDKGGYIPRNKQNVYSLNNLTAKKDKDGSITVQFGGCDGKTLNCIPIVPGWNYLVRLYRPRPEILSGKWKFPEAQHVN